MNLFRRWWFWTIVVLVILYGALIVYRAPAILEQQQTEEAVARIEATRLTMADVDGSRLPPPPDAALADATVEGIDVNGNGIRDDVELAIFERYPDDIQLRAALLQYAMALQMYLTEVFNSSTIVPVLLQEERASFCIGDALPRPALDADEAEWQERYVVQTSIEEEVQSWTLNTIARQERFEQAFREHMTSYGSASEPYCDIGS